MFTLTAKLTAIPLEIFKKPFETSQRFQRIIKFSLQL